MKNRERDEKTEALKAKAEKDQAEAEDISNRHHERNAAKNMAKAAADNLANVKRQWGK